jgi:hypothetical protein
MFILQISVAGSSSITNNVPVSRFQIENRDERRRQLGIDLDRALHYGHWAQARVFARQLYGEGRGHLEVDYAEALHNGDSGKAHRISQEIERLKAQRLDNAPRPQRLIGDPPQ